jgi:hypothetical protein
MGTIRCQLIKIGAQVIQSCRRLWVHSAAADGYPWPALFMTLWRRLAVT